MYPRVKTTILEGKMACTLVASLSRYFIFNYTKPTIINLVNLTNALNTNRPLITITNHDSTIDDPLLFGKLLIKKDYYHGNSTGIISIEYGTVLAHKKSYLETIGSISCFYIDFLVLEKLFQSLEEMGYIKRV